MITAEVDGLRLRRVMGRKIWAVPERFGPGWAMRNAVVDGSVIVTIAPDDDGVEWVHASIAYRHRLPTYDELCQLHRAVFGDGFAYQQFVPPELHVSIHEHALHLWGRADGKPVLPVMDQGTI